MAWHADLTGSRDDVAAQLKDAEARAAAEDAAGDDAGVAYAHEAQFAQIRDLLDNGPTGDVKGHVSGGADNDGRSRLFVSLEWAPVPAPASDTVPVRT